MTESAINTFHIRAAAVAAVAATTGSTGNTCEKYANKRYTQQQRSSMGDTHAQKRLLDHAHTHTHTLIRGILNAILCCTKHTTFVLTYGVCVSNHFGTALFVAAARGKTPFRSGCSTRSYYCGFYTHTHTHTQFSLTVTRDGGTATNATNQFKLSSTATSGRMRVCLPLPARA